jgi:hypothetical protein
VSGRPRHPDKDIEALLRSLEADEWRVIKGRKYFKAYRGCGVHKKTIHITPSGPTQTNSRSTTSGAHHARDEADHL